MLTQKCVWKQLAWLQSKYATTDKRRIAINWIQTQYSILCILSVPSFQVLLCNTVSRYRNTIYKPLVWMYIASTIWERWGEVKPLIVHEERAKWGLTEELFLSNLFQVFKKSMKHISILRQCWTPLLSFGGCSRFYTHLWTALGAAFLPPFHWHSWHEMYWISMLSGI